MLCKYCLKHTQGPSSVTASTWLNYAQLNIFIDVQAAEDC